MGLKTTNYEIKDKAIKISEAYALIKNLKIYGEYGEADFVVQTSRDNCFDKSPLEFVTIKFQLNRNENPLVTAYKKATEGNVYHVVDPVTRIEHELRQGMPFCGWETDIVGEESVEAKSESEEVTANTVVSSI